MESQGQGLGAPADFTPQSFHTLPSSATTNYSDLPAVDNELGFDIDISFWVNHDAPIVSNESTPAHVIGKLPADSKRPSPAPSSESETSQTLGDGGFADIFAAQDAAQSHQAAPAVQTAQAKQPTSPYDQSQRNSYEGYNGLAPPSYQTQTSSSTEQLTIEQIDAQAALLFPPYEGAWEQPQSQQIATDFDFGGLLGLNGPGGYDNTQMGYNGNGFGQIGFFGNGNGQMTVTPDQLIHSLQTTPDTGSISLPPSDGSVGMKRSASDDTVDSHGSTSGQPAKKRGRPAKVLDSAQSAASPLPKTKRQSSKPSVAKPKAVVPQKYLKDGSAQAALGMTEDEILTFPDFDALLLAVAPDLKDRAITFGQVIENGRRQAAESAQQTRAAKESKLNDLTAEVARLRQGYQQLLALGRITAEEAQAFIQ